MRVISGEFKGRRLKAVPGQNTRPTTDKVKESLFNIIGPYFDGGNCLDLYAGSGSLGIEAVSRGMAHAVLVDKQYKAIQTINENVEMTRVSERFSVLKKDARQALEQLAAEEVKLDVVFLDPPYKSQRMVNDIQLLTENHLLNDYAIVVCETAKETELPETVHGLSKIRETVYGTIRMTVYEKDRKGADAND